MPCSWISVEFFFDMFTPCKADLNEKNPYNVRKIMPRYRINLPKSGQTSVKFPNPKTPAEINKASEVEQIAHTKNTCCLRKPCLRTKIF